MIIVMDKNATPEAIRVVIEQISSYGLNAIELPGGDRTVVGVASSIPPELREPLAHILQAISGVDHITHVSKPYKLASREFHPEDTYVRIGNVVIGSQEQIIIAGPCAIESREQMFESAEAVKNAGAKILRGGAYKPRTSPYSFQGLGESGLKMLQEAGQKTGLVTISEVIDSHDIPVVSQYVDILQIGARNMQNFPLLIAAGQSAKPVLLKRGPSASIDELLLSAEYILSQGNPNVILCERGVHPLDKTYTRNTLDLSAVPVIKNISHLPVMVDPSHATGDWKLIAPMSMAAIACGADGLEIEVHPHPKEALCDARQALQPDLFSELMKNLSKISTATGRTICG